MFFNIIKLYFTFHLLFYFNSDSFAMTFINEKCHYLFTFYLFSCSQCENKNSTILFLILACPLWTYFSNEIVIAFLISFLSFHYRIYNWKEMTYTYYIFHHIKSLYNSRRPAILCMSHINYLWCLFLSIF